MQNSSDRLSPPATAVNIAESLPNDGQVQPSPRSAVACMKEPRSEPATGNYSTIDALLPDGLSANATVSATCNRGLPDLSSAATLHSSALASSWADGENSQGALKPATIGSISECNALLPDGLFAHATDAGSHLDGLSLLQTFLAARDGFRSAIASAFALAAAGPTLESNVEQPSDRLAR